MSPPEPVPKILIVWLGLLLLIAGGCGKKGEEVPGLPLGQAVTEAPRFQVETVVERALAGSVQGEVLFEGEVPAQTVLQMEGNPECRALHPPGKILGGDVLVQDGKLQNAFVYIKTGLEGKTFSPPETPVIVDNRTCIYQPHVAGVMMNQPVELRNSDPTLHNVHALPEKQKEWNVGLPFQGMKLVKKFSEPEVMVRLKCDVHPWMAGYIGVLAHPYFYVTGADGRFELQNLPPGDYTVAVWHERFGTLEQTVKVGEGEIKEAVFRFPA